MHSQNQRPIPFQGDLRNLPEALAPLKALPNWVCWRFTWKVDKTGKGSWTKPPYQPNNPTRHAKNNDPKTWGSYEQALTASRRASPKDRTSLTASASVYSAPSTPRSTLTTVVTL